MMLDHKIMQSIISLWKHKQQKQKQADM